MDEFPIHPPPAGSPRRMDKRESGHKEVTFGIKKCLTFDLSLTNDVCEITSWVGVENLNAIAGCQSLLKQWGELL